MSMGGDALRSLKDSLLTSPWRQDKESGSSLQCTSHLLLGFSRDNLRVERRNGLTANSVRIWTVNSRKKRQETERGNGDLPPVRRISKHQVPDMDILAIDKADQPRSAFITKTSICGIPTHHHILPLLKLHHKLQSLS